MVDSPTMPSTWRNRLLGLAAVVALTGLWQAASMLIGLEIILPGPAATLVRVTRLLESPGFAADVLATVTRGLIGFGLSAAVALALGVATGRSDALFVLLQPAVGLVRATPVMSVILLAMIWFHTEGMPIVAFLMCFPVLYGNGVEGIRSLDRDLVDMARAFQVRRRRIFTGLYLPSILPYLVAGFSATLGLSWKVVVAAGVLGQPARAVGSRLRDSKVMLDTVNVEFVLRDRVPAAERREAVASVLALVGLAEFRSSRPAERRTVLFVTDDIHEALFPGDDILVLSPRPAVVRDRVANPILRPDRAFQSPGMLALEKDLCELLLR